MVKVSLTCCWRKRSDDFSKLEERPVELKLLIVFSDCIRPESLKSSTLLEPEYCLDTDLRESVKINIELEKLLYSS